MVQTSLGAHGASVHRMLDEIACVVESGYLNVECSEYLLRVHVRKYSRRPQNFSAPSCLSPAYLVVS
jgi:hypothetical protein